MAYCDLHLHTTASDGADSPATVVERARVAGLAALAITDHDTLAGVGEAAAAAEAAGIRFLVGVEISAIFERREVHILGYGVDTGNDALQTSLATLRESRSRRGRAVLDKLAALGIELDRSALEAAHGENLGRLHIATALRDAGQVRIVQEAFDRFLNPGRPAYVPKESLPADEAIAAIQGAGGLAFLAHPGLQRQVRRMLPELFRLPFDGIEAYHISHGPDVTRSFLDFARDRGCLVSGGSDCHGDMKGRCEMGRVQVPVSVYEDLVQALDGKRA